MCTQVWAWMTNKCWTRMDRREIYKVRDLPQLRGGGFPTPWEEKGIDSSFVFLANQTRWEFIPSDEELVSSDCEPIHLCVLSSYLIISNACINRCLVKAQPLDSLSTNSL